MTGPRPDGADAVPQIYAIRTTCTPHGPIVNCKNNSVSLTQRHDHRLTLHTRALLRHYEFSSGEVRAGLRQQNGQLEGIWAPAMEVAFMLVWKMAIACRRSIRPRIGAWPQFP